MIMEKKNYLKRISTGDYIFNLDGDELPHKSLITNIKPILFKTQPLIYHSNELIPTEGLTQEHIISNGDDLSE